MTCAPCCVPPTLSPPATPTLLSLFLCLDSLLLFILCPTRAKSRGLCAFQSDTQHDSLEARHAVTNSVKLDPATFCLQKTVNTKHVGKMKTKVWAKLNKGGGEQFSHAEKYDEGKNLETKRNPS